MAVERLREQLPPEANAEDRDLVGNQPLKEAPLVAQPAMAVFLVEGSMARA